MTIEITDTIVYQKYQEGIAVADRKKEQERDELHRAIWAIADELRGAVDDILEFVSEEKEGKEV